MTEHLEPCPNLWCESHDLQFSDRIYFGVCYNLDGFVECQKCHIKGPHKETKAEAIAAWNTRTRAPIPDEAELVGIVANEVFGMMVAGPIVAHEVEVAAVEILRPYLTDQSARVAELEKQVRAWKVEADRVRNAHDATSSYSENMSIAEIIDWLKEHRFTHSDWASWFEQHPKDPRIKSGIGTADFHRKVEARYNSYISALEKTDARVAELEAHCDRLGSTRADRYWEARWRDADAELKALKSGEEG